MLCNKVGLCSTDYVVEKCEDGSDVWDKVPGLVANNSLVAKDLEPGKKYKFRVKAVNRLGQGEPCETNKAILAKNPYGQLPCNSAKRIFLVFFLLILLFFTVFISHTSCHFIGILCKIKCIFFIFSPF